MILLLVFHLPLYSSNKWLDSRKDDIQQNVACGTSLICQRKKKGRKKNGTGLTPGNLPESNLRVQKIVLVREEEPRASRFSFF